MTFSSRLLSPLRPARLLPAVLLAVLACFALAASRAGAVVVTVGGTTVGLQSSNQEFLLAGPLREDALNHFFEEPEPSTFANNTGNPVLHGSNVYAVYWDPTAHYHGDWQGLINGFLHNVANESNALNSVFAVNEQYTDKTNVPAYGRTSFRGAYTDTTSYPLSKCEDPHPLLPYKPHETGPIVCLTDKQINEQLQAFITEQGLPRGMSTVYYMLTPPGVTVCLDAGGEEGHCSDFAQNEEEEAKDLFSSESYEHSFCSYHSAVNPGGLSTGDANTILYAVVPWTAGGLGDGQLARQDQTKNFYCQDGGFDPASKPTELHAEELSKEEEEQRAKELKEEEEAGLESEHAEPPKHRVVQEPNQHACPTTDGFCDVGLADLIINQVATEQQNIVTNPLLNAWQDNTAKESTDECRNFFAPAEGSYEASPETGAGSLFNQTYASHRYYVNNGFNLAALKLNYPGVPCLHAVALDPKFTTPENVTTGEVVGFDGMESNISLGAATKFSGETPAANYATFTWDFGDGTPTVTGYAPGAKVCPAPWISPCAASVFHTYQYGGTYHVTLTATDVGGNSATVSNPIVVAGPPPPGPEESKSGSGGGGGSTGSTGGGSSTSTSGTATTPGGAGSTLVTPGGGALAANPVATATIVSRSLKTALRKGLMVRYSVNEQVAGRFEVLLSRSVAKRLGLSGLPASGLAAGASPQIVLAKAILITTKAGRSTVAIQFSKSLVKRLRRSHKLTFTLRMVVRNAASHSPASTTVVTAATLSH